MKLAANDSSTRRERLLRFGQQTASMVTRAVDAHWGCFYLLDAATNIHSFAPYLAPAELRQAYIEFGLEHADPLHPRFLIKPRRHFATVPRPGPRVAQGAQYAYWNVMRDFGVQRAGELMFWDGNRPIGGLSLIWLKDPPAASLDRASVVRPYVEFNLVGTLREPLARHSSDDLAATFGLSPREREVVSLVCRGHTNARIAAELGISFATVKTHLLHIFTKANVTNRASLLARLMLEV